MTLSDDPVLDTHPSEATLNLNRIVAWVGFALGVYTGLAMGLWSFDGPVAVPAWLGAYTDTSRRLARLGHIALFGLGFLNLHLVKALGTARMTPPSKQWAALAMNFGNVLLPLTLFAAALVPVCKYFLPVPALSVAVAVTLTAIGVIRQNGKGARAHR
jgi:hypothetical protein